VFALCCAPEIGQGLVGKGRKMSSLNKVFLMGNLTRDPEMRSFAGGGHVCAIGLAVNRRFHTSQGEDREEVCFVDVDVFGRQAENVATYLRKGSPVLIEGRLRLDQWDDRQTGQKRSRLKVTAESVQFIGAPNRGGSEPGNESVGGYRPNDSGHDGSCDTAIPSTNNPPYRNPPQYPRNSSSQNNTHPSPPPSMPGDDFESGNGLPF